MRYDTSTTLSNLTSTTLSNLTSTTLSNLTSTTLSNLTSTTPDNHKNLRLLSEVEAHPKMQEQEAIKKLVGGCSEALKRGFVFGSVGEDKTLSLFFKHNAFVHEFNVGHKQIIEKMREIYKNEKLQGVIYFKKVVAKIAPIGITKSKSKNNTKCEYCERSKGNFSNNCENEKIRNLFEDIREIIKARNEV